MSYRVKGTSINTKFDFVRERFGEEAEAMLRERVRSDQAPRILASAWVPFEIYVDVLRAIADLFYRGNVQGLQEAGRFSAKQALTTTYKTFVTRRSFAEFLERMSSLHHLFYSEGRSEVDVADDGHSCTITLHDKPELPDEDLEVALGFYLGAGSLLGHHAIRGSYRVSDTQAVFQLSWD